MSRFTYDQLVLKTGMQDLNLRYKICKVKNSTRRFVIGYGAQVQGQGSIGFERNRRVSI